MNDLPPDSHPVPPDPDPTPTQALPAEQRAAHEGREAAPPTKRRLRNRLWTLRDVIAVALATAVIGGLGGAALATAANRSDDGRPGPGRFQRGGQGGMPGMMEGHRRDRMKQWREQRGMGQRQWDRDGGPPGLVPRGRPPSPSAPPTP